MTAPFGGPQLTRRQFLRGLGLLGGAGAVYSFLTTAGDLPARAGTTEIRDLPPESLAGLEVVVLGAGLAGLAAGFRLARAGAQVTLLEAEDRLGGRSLTLRAGDRFKETGWDRPLDVRFVGAPQETQGLYFNAGPGRIPAHHDYVLHYCRRLGVPLQPYVFASRSNLLQDDRVFGGKPVPLRRIKHDLRGYVAELLAKVADQGRLDRPVSEGDQDALLAMLRSFGALSRADARLVYRGSARLGYAEPPGAGLDPGRGLDPLPFEEILRSRFWASGLFEDMRINWQSSLLQPTGGMDQLWRAIAAAEARPGTPMARLVRTGAVVVRIDREDARIRIGYRDLRAGSLESMAADYCIATMAPPLLGLVDGNLFEEVDRRRLRHVGYAPACKVAWQAKSRFWEQRDRIFGGISWTRHPISQIWYPSEGYLSSTGILVGAYTYGAPAAAFGRLSHAERLQLALDGGEKLHAGFAGQVYEQNGLSIAWQDMPFQAGGWAAEPYATAPALYLWLNRAQPFGGRLFLAGDYLSFLPGWQEGALRAAHLACERIHEAVVRRP